VWITSTTTNALTPTSIALGNFDGIHRGHQRVVQPVLTPSPSEVLATTPGGHSQETTPPNQPYTTVVTFNPHPREFFSGQSRQLLTPLPEKIAILEKMGVEQLVLLPFDRELAALSPETFVEKILIQELQAKQICVGEDFRFGKGRTGTAKDLSAIAPSFGSTVNIIPLHTCHHERISSSAIRHALEKGDIPKANRLLGRPYTLTGSVVTGQKLGRTLGFPTANLDVSPEKFLPRFGVYSAKVQLSNPTDSLKAVLNIGCRPTVAGEDPTIEIHLLDWSGNLYGQTLSVHLHTFIRPEQKFSSLDNLKAQITQDCETAKQHLKP
jgi:riboflavin kinase/FMN adenylyltransferase